MSERTLDGGGELLSLEGDTTTSSAERLRTRVDEIGRRGKRTVIVDLSRVSFVDSSVVQALGDVAAAAKKRGGRVLVVEPVDPMIARPLEMGRLDLVAEVHPTLDQAARAMHVPAGTLQPAIPPPAPPPEPANRARRALFGRRHTDQEILRELGQLRRLAQDLRRETGLYQQASAEDIERRRTAEAALLAAHEEELRSRQPDVAEELAAARAQIEQARAQASEARSEAERMEAEAEDAHARIQALEADLAAAVADANASRDEASRMEAEAEDAHARIQALEGDLAAAREAAESLRADLESARAAGATAPAASGELEAARAEADRMEAEAEEAHARIQALEAENAELRAALEQARASASIEQAEADRRAAAEHDDERTRREAEAEADRVRAEEEARRVQAEKAQREAERARLAAEEDERRQAEERAAREAEDARLRAEEEAARKPRPKVPVWADPAPINLNTADLEELMLLPGIGRRPAERIIAVREQSGGFEKVDDLYAIAEIPKDRVTKIRPYVRV